MVTDYGLRVTSLGFRVQGSGFRDQRVRDQGYNLYFMDEGRQFRG
jgi:hypothetical protein